MKDFQLVLYKCTHSMTVVVSF